MRNFAVLESSFVCRQFDSGTQNIRRRSPEHKGASSKGRRREPKSKQHSGDKRRRHGKFQDDGDGDFGVMVQEHVGRQSVRTIIDIVFHTSSSERGVHRYLLLEHLAVLCGYALKARQGRRREDERLPMDVLEYPW